MTRLVASGGAARRDRDARCRHRAIVTVVTLSALILSSVSITFTPAAANVSAAVQGAVRYPGPLAGALGGQALAGTNFTTSCNAAANAEADQVGRTTIITGSAIVASTGCGAAIIPIYAPGTGHFTASFGIGTTDTTGRPGKVRVRALDRNGFSLSVSDVTVTKSSVVPIDLDVAHASAVQMSFFEGAQTYVYAMRLTGSARALTPVARSASLLPAGARPVALSQAAISCNAHTATDPMTVTLVGLPAGGLSATGCGQAALSLPAGTQGTFALLYGADDRSGVGNEFVYLRALDAQGNVLGKAVGVAAVGIGVQALWVDLTPETRSVQVYVDGGTTITVDLSSAVLLARHAAPYVAPNRVQSGGSAGGAVTIDPHAFASQCNSSVGLDDITVGHVAVVGGTYLSTYQCGSASLFFCCTDAEGTLQARFAVPDTEPVGKPASTTVVIKDKDDHVLYQHSYTALRGNPAALIVLNVHRASIISFSFGGTSGLLYNLRLSGIATVSERIYPPSVPPLEGRGVAIDPHALQVHCNAQIATTDLRVVGATTLEGWALQGEACGEADLTLNGHPLHDFAARVGILLGEPSDTRITLRAEVLTASGTVLRTVRVLARYGYGTQPFRISLRGGATLRLVWDERSLAGTVVYAMTGL